MHIEIKLSRQRNRMINFPMTVSHSCFTDAWSGDSEHQQQQQREAETTASDDAGASLFFQVVFFPVFCLHSPRRPCLYWTTDEYLWRLLLLTTRDGNGKKCGTYGSRMKYSPRMSILFFYVVQCPLWLCNACVDISVCMHRSWLQTRCSECCTWHSSTSCTSTVSNDPGHAAMLHIFYTNASISVLNYHCCC